MPGGLGVSRGGSLCSAMGEASKTDEPPDELQEIRVFHEGSDREIRQSPVTPRKGDVVRFQAESTVSELLSLPSRPSPLILSWIRTRILRIAPGVSKRMKKLGDEPGAETEAD